MNKYLAIDFNKKIGTFQKHLNNNSLFDLTIFSYRYRTWPVIVGSPTCIRCLRAGALTGVTPSVHVILSLRILGSYKPPPDIT